MQFVTREEINAVVKPLVDGIETLNKSLVLMAHTGEKLEKRVLDLEKQLAESKKAKPAKEPAKSKKKPAPKK